MYENPLPFLHCVLKDAMYRRFLFQLLYSFLSFFSVVFDVGCSGNGVVLPCRINGIIFQLLQTNATLNVILLKALVSLNRLMKTGRAIGAAGSIRNTG